MAAQLPDTQKRAAKNSAAQNTPPMVTVYDGGITEKIVHGRLDTKLNFLFARNWGSYQLKDGRYVYEECTGSKKSFHVKKKVYSGIRPDIFEFLTETDRNDTNGQRKAKDHADYSARYEDGGEDENGDFHQSAMDKAAFQQWVNKETRDAAEDDPIYPDELMKQDFVPGENKVNNQRWQMRRQVTYHASYYVIEEAVQADAGYVLETKYSNDANASADESASKNGAEKSVNTNGSTITIIKTETACVELPATGGPGTLIFTSFGLALMILAGVLMNSRKRKTNR